MAGTRSSSRLQRQRELNRLSAAADPSQRLPPELLAEIHGASGEKRNLLETPWLLLPGPHEYDDKATILSLASGKSVSVRTSDVAIGSSGGWLVTVDKQGALRMVNPITAAHADLPTIATIPFIHQVFSAAAGGWFTLHFEPFLKIRFGGSPPPPEHKHFCARTYTIKDEQMRLVFYRKVVLSASPCPGNYAAMLIMDRHIGAPAFTRAEDPVWKMAPSRDGVEDAIHHNGRFLSITHTGHVEAWQRNVDTGEFTSDDAVAPRLVYEDEQLRRKYLVASTDGRLMVVLKHSRDEENPRRRYCRVSKDTRVFFKVQILDHDKGRWEEAADIGDAAIFVGVNGSMCLSTREHKRITAGCIYFTDDDVGAACLRNAHPASYDDTDDIIDELRDVGFYSIKAGKVQKQ